MSTSLRRGRQRTREEIGTTRALDRGLAVLEELATASELPLADIARRTGMSPSTVFRMLETLRQRGYADQSKESGLYRIGPKAFEVGAGFIRGLKLDRLAPPIMAQLVEDLGETVSLSVRDGRDTLYLEQIEGRHRVRMATRPGVRLPLHATAAGKVLLAWAWEDRVDAALGPEPYAALTPRTILRRERFLADLAAARRQGYGLDDEECEPDLRCIAAPVRDRAGEVMAALSLSALATRLPVTAVGAAAERLIQAADQLTQRLGGTPATRRAPPTASEAIFLDG